jgi:hypothetical protein
MTKEKRTKVAGDTLDSEEVGETVATIITQPMQNKLILFFLEKYESLVNKFHFIYIKA